MAADQAEIHRDRSRDCVEKEEDGQFRWEKWEWESTVDEVGSARGAFAPRREVVRRQDDGQDEGGRRQGEVVGRQAHSGKRQDGGDWRQYADWREKEGDMRQEGDDRRRGAGAQTRSDRDGGRTREEIEKGVSKG